MAKFRVAQDELWPIYVLTPETQAKDYERQHYPLIEVSEELYRRFTMAHREFIEVRAEIAKLYYATQEAR
jgi:hypothetical protein